MGICLCRQTPPGPKSPRNSLEAQYLSSKSSAVDSDPIKIDERIKASIKDVF